MSKVLVIKGADFSANALDNISGYSVELTKVKSALNIRSLKYNNGLRNNHYWMFLESQQSPDKQWYTYIADVSEYVGRTCKIRANNGYADQIIGNGAFVNSSFPTKTQGFTETTTGTDYESALVDLVCRVTSAENSNRDIDYEYVIPQGATKVVVTSKTEVRIFIKDEEE